MLSFAQKLKIMFYTSYIVFQSTKIVYTLLMHLPLAHVNWSSEHGWGVAQWWMVAFSSAPSTQSGSPSQSHFFGIHCALPHSLLATQVNSVSSSHLLSSAN